ncbi:hypothetical protein [Tabrizicola sp.]|uniref:hypothetical protein n=1 Tax=Tabrizicola sp. TaxID=2005166 RepID=UPI00260BFF25|nr:hypothetical protein [Tabrizicola sp.]MDM7932826.1 hypothetical protein [Tabrizicola sp.]
MTGLAFLGVGIFAFVRGPEGDDRRAAAALALVGIASASQHGFSVVLTVWADIAANLIYLVLLGVLILRRLVGVGALAAGVGAFCAVALVFQVSQSGALRQAFGVAADMFFILMLVLFGAALALRARDPATASRIALSAAVLAAGLPFRFLDPALCGVWPFGTHGIWHLINATSAALLLSALARLSADRSTDRPSDRPPALAE